MSYLRKYTDIFILVAFFMISLTIVATWYSGVAFYGGGEEGLSLWRPKTSFVMAKSVWLDVGLGYPSPFFVPRLPFYAIATFLNTFLGAKSLQQLFFGGSMLVAFSGVYLFVKKFVKKSITLALFSGLFYVFNLYTQSQIFSRFVYTGIIAWAFVPLFLYLFAKWLEEGRGKHLLIFLTLSLLASQVYSHPSYILIFWFIILLWYLVYMLKSPNKLRPTIRFVTILTLWAFTNIWWIYPMLKLSGSAGGNPSIRGWEYDYLTLQGLSRDFTNFDVFLLRQKYYFEKSGYWGDFYKTSFSFILSISGFLIMLIGVLRKKFIKNKAFFVFLLFSGWFLSKGVNFPSGEVFYKYLFMLLPPMGMFRNSYEKLGVVFLFPYATFFAVGVLTLADLFKRKIKIAFYALVLILITGYLVWPMWTGKLFSDLAQVSVPGYYHEANKFFNESKSDVRVLSLPFVPGEGVNYTWEGGSYYGLEPSQFLFDRPFVSWTIPNLYAVEKSQEIIKLLAENQLPDGLLKQLGVSHVVLHNDMNSTYSGAEGLEKTARMLSNHHGLDFVEKIGHLDVYSVPEAEGLVSTETDCQYKPSPDYRKLNARRYIITIHDARCPLDLILKTTFHDFWQARINQEILKEHFLVYDYANGWKVNKVGDYEIDIIFKIWPWE